MTQKRARTCLFRCWTHSDIPTLSNSLRNALPALLSRTTPDPPSWASYSYAPCFNFPFRIFEFQF